MSGRHRRGGSEWRLRTTDLTVARGPLIVLTGVTLSVAAGQLLAVTGPSGSGKTSLLLTLAGELPTPGEPPQRATSGAVVSIPQGNELVAVLTALENVTLPLLAAGRTDAAAAAEEAMAAVGVDAVAEQLVDELSGGEQQRVAVARGLAQEADVLLADEPTSELDATTRGRVLAALRARAEAGTAVVLSTHDPAAAEVCDAELHLTWGRATWRREPA